jgi:hypothetical protein
VVDAAFQDHVVLPAVVLDVEDDLAVVDDHRSRRRVFSSWMRQFLFDADALEADDLELHAAIRTLDDLALDRVRVEFDLGSAFWTFCDHGFLLCSVL